jgi:hypothetical protein
MATLFVPSVFDVLPVLVGLLFEAVVARNIITA